MTVSRTIIDLLGNIFDIYTVNEFYKLIFGKVDIDKRYFKIANGVAILLSSIFVAFLKDLNFLTPLVALGIYYIISNIYSKRIPYKIFLSLLLVAFSVASEIICGLVEKNILDVNISVIHQNIAYYTQGVLFSKFLVFIIIKLMIARKLNNSNLMSSKIPLMLSIFPISSFFAIYTIAVFTYQTTSLTINLITSGTIIFLILSNIIVFYVFEHQSELEHKSVQLKYVQDLLKMQKEHYLELYKSQQETRRVKHDIKNCLIAISGYLEAGEYQKAAAHIQNYAGQIQNVIEVIDTGCPAIDAILKVKLQKAEEIGAKIDYKIILPENLLIDAIDLSAILANGLDNAIEAIGKAQTSTCIQLNVMPRQDYFFINIRNPINEAVDTVHLKTSKPNPAEHGYGLKNIGLIAEKYSGNVNIKSENSIFSLSVLLRNDTFAV